ncbi:long-chain-acyl-CoA synthetase [Acinetobacter rudis]|uniref:Long-chain-acyl-CoA synthetase n=1 Tax=Acinetobacter rudis TaxID=632955 RepID=A0AAW8JCS9_9GAMM|nr:long-chain-acyl-CoA synthetase [Acinetobacter rudis]MDQ8936911.1 long-chain-acyl-CoA synthetase [Acinetobacter rudis]MDQ9019131.1 long-chain-acyl-CoA synthetase [Acinetobacter rudis]
MNQSLSQDLIRVGDVVAKLPQFIHKAPNILSGLKQAYLRTPNSPAGLGLAFEKAVKRNPQGIALRFEEQQFSYQELNNWINQLAHYFISVGFKKGDVIAVMIENRPELIATVVALAKLGIIAALVNTSQSGQVLSHSINLVEAKAVVVGEECRVAIEQVRTQLNIAHEHFYWYADQETQKEPGNAPAGFTHLAVEANKFPKFNVVNTQKVQGKDGLFYVYTSGTTGLPKAVIFTNSRWTLAYGTYGHILNLNKDDVMYCTLPLYHATGMVVCWCGVIAGSATLALRRKYSTSAFWSDVEKYNASVITYVGEMCRYLVDAPQSPLERKHRVRKMIGNGIRPNIWGKFKQRFGIEEVLELYASSEGNVGFSNIFNFDNTVGFSPTPFAIIEFDREKNEPIRDKHGFCIKVKKGEIGLLVGKITRRSPFDGYTDPEKNRAVTIQNVLKKGDAYFMSGDLVRNLGCRHAQFIDRLGDTFRWKGENVSTTQVENICSEQHKVSEAIVYGVEIPHTNGRAGMAAITLTTENHSLNEQDLLDLSRDFKQNLPHYAVPVFLRVLNSVDTTGTFKYQKNKLKDEGFNPEKTSDKLYVLLPNSQTYSEVTAEVFANIQAYKYRF